MADTTLLNNTTETIMENTSKKETSANPNDSAFMLDELLMMREFAEMD